MCACVCVCMCKYERICECACMCALTLLFCVKEKGLHRGTGKHACTDLKLRSCHGQNHPMVVLHIHICTHTHV